MKTGYVVGRVWATKRLGEMPSGALLEIDLEATGGGGGPGERLVAFDPLGCGEGERVLVTQGSVAKGWFQEGQSRYELKEGRKHHHHIRCQICGRIVDLLLCPLKKITKLIEERSQFVVGDHTLEFTGFCPQCQ